MFEIWWRFEKWCKKVRISWFFLDNCIWIGCRKFSQLRREYFISSAANVLTNSLDILDITKESIFELYVPQLMRTGDSGVWDALACLLSNRVLKRNFLDIPTVVKTGS